MRLHGFAILALFLSFLGALAGCDSAVNPSKESTPLKPASVSQAQSKEPVLYTGQQAFNQMLGLARKVWAPDAQPIRLESDLTSETTGQNGKSTVWRGFFASPSRQIVKTFVCSGSRQPDAPAFGISAMGVETAYTAKIIALVFQPLLLRADSDQAFAAAQQHGGESLIKKDGKQPVTYVLALDPKQNAPVWYVIYGKNAQNHKGIGIVNATTGTFLRAVN